MMSTAWLTPNDIAEMLQISYEKALDFIKYSGVKFTKIGRQYRVFESSLNAFLAKNTYIDLNH
ncbi:MAG: helix-turn-helix domain-containing protein [Clostridia bacterium]|nr:helix-turn-helix domain-containing protein [Clostridia bacterium]